MEASMGTEAQPQDTGQQDATPEQSQTQVPPEVMQRMDELGGRFDQIEPMLGQIQQALAPGEEEIEDPGYEEYFNESGELTPESLQQMIDKRAQQIAQEQSGPLAERLERMETEWKNEEVNALMDEFPQLADAKFVQEEFSPYLSFAAQQAAREIGQGDEFAQQLMLSPSFIRTQYLARTAESQAQQGVPAGGQEVHLEGGSGNPGSPEVNQTQEFFRSQAQVGATGGPWGRPLNEL